MQRNPCAPLPPPPIAGVPCGYGYPGSVFIPGAACGPYADCGTVPYHIPGGGWANSMGWPTSGARSPVQQYGGAVILRNPAPQGAVPVAAMTPEQLRAYERALPPELRHRLEPNPYPGTYSVREVGPRSFSGRRTRRAAVVVNGSTPTLTARARPSSAVPPPGQPPRPTVPQGPPAARPLPAPVPGRVPRRRRAAVPPPQPSGPAPGDCTPCGEVDCCKPDACMFLFDLPTPTCVPVGKKKKVSQAPSSAQPSGQLPVGSIVVDPLRSCPPGWKQVAKTPWGGKVCVPAGITVQRR